MHYDIETTARQWVMMLETIKNNEELLEVFDEQSYIWWNKKEIINLISEVIKKCINKNWLGVILACVSPEIIEKTIDEVKQLNIPFGFKANLWKTEEPIPVHKFASPTDEIGANPTEAMGTREDYTDVMFLEFSKRMMNKGATILGGCCETKPFHIKKIAGLKN